MKAIKLIVSIFGAVVICGAVVVLVWAVYGALNETPPEHPLDYYNYQPVLLTEDVATLEQGRNTACQRVLLDRENAKLTRVFIELASGEISRVHYRFKFPYVSQDTPHGFSWVEIDFRSNSINSYSCVHDYEKITEISDIIADNKDLDEIFDRAVEYTKQNFLPENIQSITIHQDMTEIVFTSADGTGKKITIEISN